MNRRDFIRSLVSLPALAFLPWRKPEVVTFTGTETLGRMLQAGPGMSVSGWFKPPGKKWQFVVGKYDEQAAIKFVNGAMLFDGHIASISVCGEVLPDEQIEALYQQTRQWFGV